MITHSEYMKKLPPERQARIKAWTKQLIAEESTLRDLRKTLQLSQEKVADLLGMRQGDLSKFERRTDAYLSTVRRYVEAMGGTLDLIAQFPNRDPVRVINIGDLYDDVESEKPQRKSASRSAAREATKSKAFRRKKR